MRRTLALAAIVIVGGAAASAQPARFEVATLKISPPAQGDTININLGNIVNGKLTLTNAGLSDYLKFAYGLVSNSQLAGPDWIFDKTVHFDLVGVAPAGTAREQVQLMLRDLLDERFQVKKHFEKRELAYLALIAGKNGVKMVPAKEVALQANGPQILGNIHHSAMPMDLLARLLSRFERDTVIDLTGLTGTFEVSLQWTPENKRLSAAQPDAGEAPAGPSLYTALQEQLGLRLVPRKGQLDVLVIDRADRTPAEN